jgi:hypothetical protein
MDIVQVCAQAQGIESLDPEVSSALAPDVEYHVRAVIQVFISNSTAICSK